MKDTKDNNFSVMTGYGTIAEIGLIPSMRRKGLGGIIVNYAEKELIKLNIDDLYVIAYREALSLKKDFIQAETSFEILRCI